MVSTSEDEVPEGWKEISRPPIHDFDKAAMLEGTLRGNREIPTEFGTNRLFDIEGVLGPVSVWGSAVLTPKLLVVKPGAYIRIEYIGKDGRTKMFRVFEKSKST